MKKFRLLFFITLSLLVNVSLFAQVEGILVEKYYIAGAADTLSFGEYQYLEEGSVTYRVFLDLEEGARLFRLFGDEFRPFMITSQSPFFNHEDRGSPFGFQIRETQLNRDVLALDSWITIGLATRNHYGIPKTSDPDGSLAAIINNRVPGVLTNAHPDAGIPLNESDGYVPESKDYTFGSGGIVDPLSGEDTVSIFSVYNDTIFTAGTSFFLQDGSRDGIMGADAENHVLIAQLTTKGEIRFRINAEVVNRAGERFLIFGTDTLLDPNKNERYSSFMNYPVVLRAGCMDPFFAEFDPRAEVDDGTWCKDSVKFGCLDPAACNYSATANYHIPELCCFDSDCALDLGIVCPGVVYGCMDPLAVNFNPLANTTSTKDKCCYISGCPDNRYIEYNPQACLPDSTACKTIIIAGCMDKKACNYNPFANRNLGCIYTGCAEINQELNPFEVNLYPNPAGDEANLVVRSVGENILSFQIMDRFGKQFFNSELLIFSNEFYQTISLGDINSGLYFIRININGNMITKRLIKH